MASSPRGQADGGLAAQLLAATAADACVLDLRSPAAFAAGHLRGASSFPFSSLSERTAELPPASCAGLRLLGAADELRRARALLNEEGSVAWTILDELLDGEALWDAAHDLGLISCDESRRLWLPSPHLPAVVPQLEAALGAESDSWRALGFRRGSRGDGAGYAEVLNMLFRVACTADTAIR